MKPIQELSTKEIEDIDLIVFDVDGVLVPRGSKIKRDGDILTIQIKKIQKKEIDLIKKLHKKGFMINISSGRSLTTLQEMFREVLDYVSLTYENGSATWDYGEITQHCYSYHYLNKIMKDLMKISNKNILGFEPKDNIITIHCKKQVKAIEACVSRYPKLYTIWNGEAYDIGIKKKQNKGVGLKMLLLKYKTMTIIGNKGYPAVYKHGVPFSIVIGDNYNDKELMDVGGISVTADRTRVEGDYYIDFKENEMPASALMKRLLK